MNNNRQFALTVCVCSVILGWCFGYVHCAKAADVERPDPKPKIVSVWCYSGDAQVFSANAVNIAKHRPPNGWQFVMPDGSTVVVSGAVCVVKSSAGVQWAGAFEK